MVGHLIDRALMPQVAVRAGIDAVDDVAIDEWLGASPTYTARMQRLMGIEGDDVGAIMKGLQLDVGFVHQYMGVSYELTDEQHGSFWLDHCGALMDVEPHGEARVVGMCHHIEDPTFDGTALATNPRARIRPIHRPPRIPAGREPHCHWTITIDPQNEPIDPTAHTLRVAQLPLASVPNERPPDRESGGKRDYRGPFDPAFRLADLSDGTLVAVAREFQEQVHLLTSSAELSIADRLGADTAREIIATQWVAASWVASERLAGAPIGRCEGHLSSRAAATMRCSSRWRSTFSARPVRTSTMDRPFPRSLRMHARRSLAMRGRWNVAPHSAATWLKSSPCGVANSSSKCSVASATGRNWKMPPPSLLTSTTSMFRPCWRAASSPFRS